MARAIPSKWSKPTADLLKVSSFYSAADLEEIFQILNFRSKNSRAKCELEIYAIGAQLNVGLHHAKCPTDGEKRAGLKRVADALGDMQKALAELDHASNLAIKMVVQAEVTDDDVVEYGGPFPFSIVDVIANERMAIATSAFENYARWLSGAIAAASTPPRWGNKTQEAEKLAVQQLMKVWKRRWGREPTSAELLNLSTAAMRPLLEKHGLSNKRKLTGCVRSALYGD